MVTAGVGTDDVERDVFLTISVGLFIRAAPLPV